jgi:hypothetical protein
MNGAVPKGRLRIARMAVLGFLVFVTEDTQDVVP